MNYTSPTFVIVLAVSLPACSTSSNDTPQVQKRNKSTNAIDEVAECLRQYKSGVEAGDLDITSPLRLPPLDAWERATMAQIRTNQQYLDALVDTGELVEDAAKVKAIREQMNPSAGVSSYEFSNIQVDGDRATADVVMTVHGERRPSIQKLVRVNGKWFVHSADSNGFSDADAKEFRETAEVTNAYAKSVSDLTVRLNAGTIAASEAQEDYVKRNMELQEKIREIRAKHPTKRP